MRRSIASLAIIRQEIDGQCRYLAQWNPKWSGYSLVGGHKRETESFRECILREVQEELGLAHNVDFAIGAEPLAHLELEQWSESARVNTNYTLEVFEVTLIGTEATRKVTSASQNCWLTLEQIRAGLAQDGKPISSTVRVVLEKTSAGFRLRERNTMEIRACVKGV